MDRFLWVDRGITEHLILHSRFVLALNKNSSSYHSDLLITRITSVNSAGIMDNVSGIVDGLRSRSLLKIGVIC